MTEKLRVFVSSTYVDLVNCREQVRLLLRRCDLEDVAMEYFVADDQRPVDKCLSAVRSSGLYIGLFAWRYGFIPQHDNMERYSVTELEYREAQARGLHCLIFLQDGSSPWPPAWIDDDRSRVKRFRDDVLSRHQCGFFRSDADVAGVIGPAIIEWLHKHRPAYIPSLRSNLDLDSYSRFLGVRYGLLDLDALTPPERDEYLNLKLQTVFVEQDVRSGLPPAQLPPKLLDVLKYEHLTWEPIQPEELDEDILRLVSPDLHKRILAAGETEDDWDDNSNVPIDKSSERRDIRREVVQHVFCNYRSSRSS